MGFKWTTDEDAVLAKHVEAGNSVEEALADLPGRTLDAAVQRAYVLGYDGVRRRVGKSQKWWRPEEDAVLRTNAGKPYAEVAQLLPGRTANACGIRARHLGLKIYEKNGGLCRAQVSAIKEARKRGWTWRKIADSIGANSNTLRWRFNREKARLGESSQIADEG